MQTCSATVYFCFITFSNQISASVISISNSILKMSSSSIDVKLFKQGLVVFVSVKEAIVFVESS